LKCKKGMIFGPVVYAIIAIIVIGVSLPIANIIITNSKQVDTEEFLELLRGENISGFVPTPWYEAAEEDYKTAVASVNTLSTAINIIDYATEFDKINNAVKNSDPEVTLTGKATGNTQGVCCMLKVESPNDNFNLYYVKEGNCGEKGAEVSGSLCRCPTGQLNLKEGPCISFKKESVKIENFEIPHDISSSGFSSYYNYATNNNDPKYIVYFESFPEGEEKAWQPINMKFFLASAGIQVALSLGGDLWGVGKKALKKTAPEVAEAAVESMVKEAKEDIIEEVSEEILDAAETKLTNELIESSNEIALLGARTILIKKLGKITGNKVFKFLDTASSYSMSIKGTGIKLESLTLDDLAIKLDLDGNDLNIFKSRFSEFADSNGKIHFDISTLSQDGKRNFLDEFEDYIGDRIKEGPSFFNRLKGNTKELDTFSKALLNAPENFEKSLELFDSKALDASTFDKAFTKGWNDAESLLGNGKTINLQEVFTDETTLKKFINILKTNREKINNRLKDTSKIKNLAKNLEEGFWYFLGAPEKDASSYVEYLFKGGAGCAIRGGGAVVTGATGEVVGAFSETAGDVLDYAAMGLAMNSAKNCYALARTTIFPIVALLYMFEDNEVVKNSKFDYVSDNDLHLAINNKLFAAGQGESIALNNIEDYNIYMTGKGIGEGIGDTKTKSLHFVSPCKVDMEISKNYCDVTLESTKLYAAKKEGAKVSVIPLRLRSSDLPFSIDKIKTYYVWDSLSLENKQDLIDDGMTNQEGILNNVMGFLFNEESDKKDVSFILANEIAYDEDAFMHFTTQVIGKYGYSCEDFIDMYEEEYIDQFILNSIKSKPLLGFSKANFPEAIPIETSNNDKYYEKSDGWLETEDHDYIEVDYYSFTNDAVILINSNKEKIENYKSACSNEEKAFYDLLYLDIVPVNTDFSPTFDVTFYAVEKILNEIFGSDLYTRTTLPEYKKEETFDLINLQDVETSFNLFDYYLREQYDTINVIEFSTYAAYKDQLQKAYGQVIKKGAPTPSNKITIPSIKAKCVEVNILGFAKDQPANYCYTTYDWTDEAFQWGLEGGIFAASLLLAPETGATSLVMMLKAADLAAVGYAIYKDYNDKYPHNDIIDTDDGINDYSKNDESSSPTTSVASNNVESPNDENVGGA